MEATQGETSSRDIVKERHTWPKRTTDEIEADIMRIQGAVARGEMDLAGRPVNKEKTQ